MALGQKNAKPLGTTGFRRHFSFYSWVWVFKQVFKGFYRWLWVKKWDIPLKKRFGKRNNRPKPTCAFTLGWHLFEPKPVAWEPDVYSFQSVVDGFLDGFLEVCWQGL